MTETELRFSEEYAEKQKNAGLIWSDEKERYAEEYAERLNSFANPIADSFREQAHLFNSQTNAVKNDKATLDLRSKVDNQLQRFANNQSTSNEYNYAEKQFLLKDHQSQKDALDRLRVDAESKTVDNFGNISAALSYGDMAKSALARDNAFEMLIIIRRKTTKKQNRSKICQEPAQTTQHQHA